MPRLRVVTPEEATGKTEAIYNDVKKKMGKVVNIFQGMANSPAALKAYLSMSAALAEGELTPSDREAIYLAVSERNGCRYCVSAHAMFAKKAGLSDDAVLAARRFDAPSEKPRALLRFVRLVMETHGFVSDAELTAVRNAGYTDGQIAEAIGYIGLATFSNYFNHVHETPLDFPEAPNLS